MARENKKSSAPVGFIIFIIFIFISIMDEMPGPVIAFGVGVLLFWVILYFVLRAVVQNQKKKAARHDHSHNRADQKRDYKINAATGQVVNRQPVRTVHTSEAHWKEQLDSLLENGTILKDEYELLLRQHK